MQSEVRTTSNTGAYNSIYSNLSHLHCASNTDGLEQKPAKAMWTRDLQDSTSSAKQLPSC